VHVRVVHGPLALAGAAALARQRDQLLDAFAPRAFAAFVSQAQMAERLSLSALVWTLGLRNS
jgi:hypothetical protein